MALVAAINYTHDGFILAATVHWCDTTAVVIDKTKRTPTAIEFRWCCSTTLFGSHLNLLGSLIQVTVSLVLNAIDSEFVISVVSLR